MEMALLVRRFLIQKQNPEALFLYLKILIPTLIYKFQVDLKFLLNKMENKSEIILLEVGR